MATRQATCRECGDIGIEDDTDPCPGLCPSCFDDKMAAVTFHFARDVDSDGLGRAIQLAHERMTRIGMTQDAATSFLAEALLDAHK